ncbi:hypothetical protein NXV73_13615 [Bacteroides salyersiae]|nr:hypothetical protein [Bacteroides salyersiae]
MAEWQLFEASDGVGIQKNILSEFTIYSDNGGLLIKSHADVTRILRIVFNCRPMLIQGEDRTGTTQREYLLSGTYLVSLEIRGQKKMRKVIIGH